MSVIARLRSRIRDDSGFTLTELMVAGMLSAVVLTSMSAMLISAMNSSTFTQGQSATMNDVRNAMLQLEKEIRGADSITWCAPSGSCIEVGAQTPDGTFRTVRYTHTGTDLQRAIYSGTEWGDPLTLVSRVSNTPSQSVFGCDTESTLLRVTIDLYVQPTPQSDPSLHMQTSIRPRNFPLVASCP